MTTYTALSDTQLQLDKPVTEAIARAGFRDNLQAIVEGDASVPTASRIVPRSIKSPYFSATRSTTFTSTALSNTSFKVPFNVETFDPDSLYDNTASGGNGYRFVPNKPGLYLVTLKLSTDSYGFMTDGHIAAVVYKNGSIWEQGTYGVLPQFSSASGASLVNSQVFFSTITTLVPMNGTTDYLEGWCYTIGGTPTLNVVSFSAVGLCQI